MIISRFYKETIFIYLAYLFSLISLLQRNHLCSEKLQRVSKKSIKVIILINQGDRFLVLDLSPNRIIRKFMGSVLTSSLLFLYYPRSGTTFTGIYIFVPILSSLSPTVSPLSRSYRLQFYISSLHPYPRPDLDLS